MSLKPVIVEGAINGIDVSEFQKGLNAKKIKEAGFEFAWIRSSLYSKGVDSQFKRLKGELQDAGLYVGAYHACAQDTSPAAQAEHFYKTCAGLGSTPGELPPLADWEHCTPSHYKPPTYPLGHPKHCLVWLDDFTKECDDLFYGMSNAYSCIPRFTSVYTYPNYLRSHPDWLLGTSLGRRPLVWASYKSGKDGKEVPWLPVAGQDPVHKVLPPWSKATFVQYSGNGGLPVPGVPGPCDRQVFNGSRTEFNRILGYTG